MLGPGGCFVGLEGGCGLSLAAGGRRELGKAVRPQAFGVWPLLWGLDTARRNTSTGPALLPAARDGWPRLVQLPGCGLWGGDVQRAPKQRAGPCRLLAKGSWRGDGARSENSSVRAPGADAEPVLSTRWRKKG